MKRTKKLLLASAAYAAMTLGFNPPALAFEEVNWVWNKDVTENVLKDVDYDLVTTPTGMVEIEKIQMNIGDVTATSSVSGINNNPPGLEGEGGTVLIDETFIFETGYDDEADPDGIDPAGPVVGEPSNILQGEILGGAVDEGSDEIDITFRATGEVELDSIEGVNDAVDLPEIESVATAVANNQSIDSSVSVQLHDAQYNWGGFSEPGSTQVPIEGQPRLLGAAFDATGNTHTNILLSAALSGALGIIEPGSVSATSTVNDIQNASIDSDATAVANNLSVDLEAVTQDDAFMIADLTQFNYADVTADSSVSGIDINNYANLGEAGFGPGEGQIALVSSVATAVGNNVDISVSSPSGAIVVGP